jgi:L-cysteine/cystine lyase
MEGIFAQTQEITRYARALLAAAPGVTIHSPNLHAGLTTFSIEGLESEPTVMKLADRGVIIRCFTHPTWMRVSTGFFNAEEDIQRLIEGIKDIQKGA